MAGVPHSAEGSTLEAEDVKPALPRPRLSAASISRIHATLRKALNDALRRYKYLDYNPALFVELEQVERPEALRWEDLDLADDDGYVGVRRNRVQVGYKVSEGSPKSFASRRTIWLDADTVAVPRLSAAALDLERPDGSAPRRGREVIGKSSDMPICRYR